MGEALAKMMKYEKREQGRQPKRPDKQWNAQERMALQKLRSEAKQSGASLTSNGKGGLPPSFVLSVMRRDNYTCKVCGDTGEGEHGGLTVHHKGGIVESEWLSNKGHRLDKNNVVTLCDEAHNRIHQQAKAEGLDSSQVLPDADKGDKRRDHGQPPAPFDR